MAIQYPYTYNVSNEQSNSKWTTGSQVVPHPASEQLSGLLGLSAGVGGLALLGRQQIKPGYKFFDLYGSIARGIEEYSPGKIFRTFQVSHMLSSLESPSLQTRYFSPEVVANLRSTHSGRVWLRHVKSLIGKEVSLGQGFRFESGQLLSGKTGNEVLLKHAGIIRNITGSAPKFQEAYARSLAGGPITGLTPALGQNIQYLDEAGKIANESFFITGGQSRLQAAKRFTFGYGTSLVERINQLARAPFELEPIASILKKVPLINKLHFAVEPSSGLKTLGKLTGKLGILGYAGYLSYQQLDWQARKSEALDKTILSEGITAGLATAYTRGKVATSSVFETLGLHTYREKQEEIAPGSTSLQKLLAFPVMGASAALGGGYLGRIFKEFQFRKSGLTALQADIATTATSKLFQASIYDTPIPASITENLNQKTISLIQQQTDNLLGSWRGKIAKSIASTQSRTGPLGFLTSMLGKMTPSKVNVLTGAAIGLGLVAPLLPGALIPDERPEELKALYSGEKRVPIRKGRWWEFGRQAYEGGRIDRFQPHWYPLMLARAEEKAIYGEDISPYKRLYLENFTYELEKKHYRERPYPITGTFGEDIPFLGPIISATIGKLIKPPKLMHTEEWTKPGADNSMQALSQHNEYLKLPPKFKEPQTPGMLEPGTPISPYSAKGIIGEQAYRMTEMIGLPGFTMTSMKQALTGEENLFSQEMQLESARRMYGAERSYWDLELGGMLGTSELLRRLYPHRRREIELYNPIRNQMPEWLPGPAERSPDFLHGDPYAQVPRGELRLPGAGYEALHPELEGVAPEDYPLMHRLSILADVAPYSSQYTDTLISARAAKNRGDLSKEEVATYNRIAEETKQRKIRKTFSSYKYKERAYTPIEAILAADNESKKQPSERPSWFSRVVGSYWETLAHKAETPFEYLTPISPAAKLIHMRTAVEDYEKTQVYGTENAFWQHPIEHFLKPFATSTARAFGWDGIPKHVKEQRDIEEYFDALKYVKFTRLKNAAQAQDNEELVKEYEQKRRESLFGINPFTFNYSQVFRALPRRERDYFNEFVKADTEERQKILEMVPENEKALFIARWKLKDAEDLQKAVKKGLLSGEQVEEADKAVSELFKERESEGFPKTQQLWAEYLSTRLEGESYPDWYRRTKLLSKVLAGKNLPGPDWVGYTPSVDLDDIKLKVVEREGRSAYDFDLWPDRIRRVARTPVIEEAAEELQSDRLGYNEIRDRIQRVLGQHDLKDVHVEVIPLVNGKQENIELDITEDRSRDMEEVYRKEGLNG